MWRRGVPHAAEFAEFVLASSTVLPGGCWGPGGGGGVRYGRGIFKAGGRSAFNMCDRVFLNSHDISIPIGSMGLVYGNLHENHKNQLFM